jgi:uncharacterized RDD family membrane protein YckC
MTEGARRAGLLLRVVAKGIDLIIIAAASEMLPRAGWLAGLVYLTISDGLFDGRSAGKRLMGIRVLSASGVPCTVRDSILRNCVFVPGLVLWKVPFVGWLFLPLTLALEFIILLGSKEGKRLGDEIAKTTVVEAAEAVEVK